MYSRVPIAQAIVDTINAPYLVLDHELRVIDASRAYYRTFDANPAIPKAATCPSWGPGIAANLSTQS